MKDDFQVSHLSPESLKSILLAFISLANRVKGIREMIHRVNWGASGLVYQAFYFTIERHIITIDQEINNLHTLFLVQSGQLSIQKTRLNGNLCRYQGDSEITLISLEHNLQSQLVSKIHILHECLWKGVCQNVNFKFGDISEIAEVQEEDKEFELESQVESQAAS